jgi:hypothetical protein
MCRLNPHAAASAGAKIIPKSAAWKHGSGRGTSAIIVKLFDDQVLIKATIAGDASLVPAIISTPPACSYRSTFGWFERVVARWQAEIAGRGEN